MGEADARGEIVLLNSAAALIAGERVKDWPEWLSLAAQSIDSGATWRKLEALQALTARLAGVIQRTQSDDGPKG
ncbi:MAG: hypothetical protein HY673_03430 [Chloroflexi bacterium]|nr:hypothetical protein [Chloroflexota bacterium]